MPPPCQCGRAAAIAERRPFALPPTAPPATGSAGSYVSLHINSAAPARTAAVRAPEPVWNERLPLECTLSDTLRVEAREEAGGDGVESALLGAAEVPLRDLATGKQLTKVVKLAGGPGSPTVTLVLAWRAKPGSSLSAHDSTMRVSLAQCRHELAISRAEKAAWENASGYLRSYGLNAPAEARNGRLDGPAAAEVLPNARPPSGKPRREGIVPLAEMVVRPDVAAAVAEAQGRAAPPEEEKALSPFQKKWKVRARAAVAVLMRPSLRPRPRIDSPPSTLPRRAARRVAGGRCGARGQERGGVARLPRGARRLLAAGALWRLQAARDALLLSARRSVLTAGSLHLPNNKPLSSPVVTLASPIDAIYDHIDDVAPCHHD